VDVGVTSHVLERMSVGTEGRPKVTERGIVSPRHAITPLRLTKADGGHMPASPIVGDYLSHQDLCRRKIQKQGTGKTVI